MVLDRLVFVVARVLGLFLGYGSARWEQWR
jgi:hypothetical protein